MPLLSSLVFLGVICSRCCEQHHCLHRDFSTSKTTALPPPLLPLLRSYHKLHHRKEISPICLSVKYCLHRTFHVPPRATRSLGVTGTRLHTPPIYPTRRHAPTHARAPLLTSALGDVICHVIATTSTTASADVICRAPADVIVDQDVDLTVDQS